MPAAIKDESDLHESGDHARAGPAETRGNTSPSQEPHEASPATSQDEHAAGCVAAIDSPRESFS